MFFALPDNDNDCLRALRLLHERQRRRSILDMEEEECHNRRTRLLLLWLCAYTNKKPSLRDILSLEGMWRRDRRIPRIALLAPAASPWMKLCDSKNDQALITLTGFDHAAFETMLNLFRPLFHAYAPWVGEMDGSQHKKLVTKNKKQQSVGGRPRLIDDRACLGLVLAWCRFKGGVFILQGWFGFTGTPANVWLKFGRRMLLKALWANDLARVRVPTDEKVVTHMDIIQQQHEHLPDVFCVADGLKISFEGCDGLSTQSMFHNGWQHGHFTSNLLVFTPDGRIVVAVLNAPGSVHDSTLAEWGNVCDKLESICERTGGECCLDSAFASCNVDCLIKSSDDITKAKNAHEAKQAKEATSLRQSAEWGMRAMQGAFPRLKDKMQFECNGERKVFLMLAVMLHNIRLELVGLNQLRNVCIPAWSRDAQHMVEQH